MPSGQAVLQANNWITPFPLKEFPRTGRRQQAAGSGGGNGHANAERRSCTFWLGWVCRVDKSSQLLDRLILRGWWMRCRYVTFLFLSCRDPRWKLRLPGTPVSIYLCLCTCLVAFNFVCWVCWSCMLFFSSFLRRTNWPARPGPAQVANPIMHVVRLRQAQLSALSWPCLTSGCQPHKWSHVRSPGNVIPSSQSYRSTSNPITSSTSHFPNCKLLCFLSSFLEKKRLDVLILS